MGIRDYLAVLVPYRMLGYLEIGTHVRRVHSMNVPRRIQYCVRVRNVTGLKVIPLHYSWYQLSNVFSTLSVRVFVMDSLFHEAGGCVLPGSHGLEVKGQLSLAIHGRVLQCKVNFYFPRTIRRTLQGKGIPFDYFYL